MITQKRLKSLFTYDPQTGLFRREINRQGGKGKVGTVNHGYLIIGIDQKTYLAHRLAWLYVYGYWTEHDLDHINRNKIDNRICNLRETSRACNMINTGHQKNNRSGVKGVHYYNQTKRWRAKIKIDKTDRHLGYFNCFVEAVCHRLAAEQCLGWDECNSCSSAHKHIEQHRRMRR